VGSLAYGSTSGLPSNTEERHSAAVVPAPAPAISDTEYTPSSYPIQPKPFQEVTLSDSFWRPKMKRNAEVTIPFEVPKFQEREHAISANVLEAAIYSFQTYPDTTLQSQVEGSIKAR
jgi:hypothetical protein